MIAKPTEIDKFLCFNKIQKQYCNMKNDIIIQKTKNRFRIFLLCFHPQQQQANSYAFCSTQAFEQTFSGNDGSKTWHQQPKKNKEVSLELPEADSLFYLVWNCYSTTGRRPRKLHSAPSSMNLLICRHVHNSAVTHCVAEKTKLR